VNFSGFKNFGLYNESEHKKLIDDFPSLYHYTTEEAFANILKTKSLWATNCQNFNDISETTHILPILKRINEKQNGMKEIYTEATNYTLIQKLERERKYTYVICFSKYKDSDALWENKDIAVNIEFETLPIELKLSRSFIKLNGISEDMYTSNMILNDIKYIDIDFENYVQILNDKYNNERLNNEEVSIKNMNNLTDIFSLLFQLSVFFFFS
jgi:hypothetical protein